MHEVFSPGFPGMLEAFYVQERLIESLMPEVFSTLVRCQVVSWTPIHPYSS
jgi:hypothetical protein